MNKTKSDDIEALRKKVRDLRDDAARKQFELKLTYNIIERIKKENAQLKQKIDMYESGVLVDVNKTKDS